MHDVSSVTARVRRRAMRAWLATGSRVECPCCGHTFRRFLRLGRSGRPNVVCPACGSLERHRLLWLYLSRGRPDLLERPLRLLHLAPEPSLQRLFQSRPDLEYVSADLASPLAEHAVDVQRLPFPDGSFDALICNHVLEHVEDDRRAMRELRRVLTPGGWAIVMVPLDPNRSETLEDPAVDTPAKRLAAYRQEDHLRLYGLDFPDRLRSAGLQVTVQNYAEDLGLDAYRRYALTGERIYLCSP